MSDIVPGSDDDVLSTAAKWKEEGREVALATVVTTWGSSPRPVGSQLVVDGDGNFSGSVSAGCVESAVVEAAGDVIEGGMAKLLDFGVADDQAWEVGLSCGGNIEIYVEKVE
jgi:xanthine/CO dehydrogenase XdhC/CoxF family maturation factor